MLVFGGAALSGSGGGYGFGIIEKPQDLLYYVYDRGIRTFDTAPIYGFNQSEKILADIFKSKREEVKIISKAGVDWHSSRRVNMSNDPKVIQKMLDESLRKFEYLDIYMIHWPDENVDIRYSFEVLAKAKDQGKIKALGLCNSNDEEIRLAEEVAPVEFLQSEFSLFNDGFKDISFDKKKMGWGTFDKGILSGSVTKDRKFSEEDCRSWAPWWKKSNWKEKVDKAQNFDGDLKHIALQYSLTNIDFTICGGKSIDQWGEIIDLSEKVVPSEVLDRAVEYFK